MMTRAGGPFNLSQQLLRNVVWMLEELRQPYELRFVDLTAGEQRSAAFRQINPKNRAVGEERGLGG